MGDAAAEEDYSLGAMGWASTKKLPILFVVEDNNLSILTEKKVRRCWEMKDVASGMKLESKTISDSPRELSEYVVTEESGPRLINVKTNRMFWHAGAGKDSDEVFDRLQHERNALGSVADGILEEYRNEVKVAWETQIKRYKNVYLT